ncbi:MAG: Ig-like domain-containing protein, partial [Bacteroidetes bacterium]|nr:Ig-like domain-containing protein [Bacteroidota bacterium]
MKQIFSLLVVAAFSTTFAFGQLTITGTSPVDLSTNVPLGSTISITFSSALDTVRGLDLGKSLFSNVQISGSPVYSPDKRTITIPVTLSAGPAYFFCVSYAKGQDASTLAAPFVFYFTTGSSFPSAAVRGTVTAGSTSFDPGGSLVVLSTISIGNDDPVFVMGSVADASGAFTIPYVADGGYFPIAAKDENGDGDIDPGKGDAVGQGDSITVSGANVTGVTIPLMTFEPMAWEAVVDSAMAMAATLPSERSLRWVRSWDTDTLGRSEEWTFHYIIPSTSDGWDVKVRSMEKRIEAMDEWAYNSCIQMSPITNIEGAAPASTFLA